MNSIISGVTWIMDIFGGLFGRRRRRKPDPTPPKPEPKPNPPNPTPEPDIVPDLITDLLDTHNSIRAEKNIGALSLNSVLTEAAQKHAEWMLRKKKLSHVGEGGSSVSERTEVLGYSSSYIGENVAMGADSVSEVIYMWYNSSGHRANMLRGSYTEVGFGKAGNYWCTVFGRPNT
jgi:uncharacterized protein YkwD